MVGRFPFRTGWWPHCNTPLSSSLIPQSPALRHAPFSPSTIPWLQNASRYVSLAKGTPRSSPANDRHNQASFHRLYFTTFPHPPPNPQVLNRQAAEPGNQPRVRARPRGGPSASPDDNASYYYFTIDDQLLYLSFFQDWGPLNIAMVYKACILIHELLEVS